MENFGQSRYGRRHDCILYHVLELLQAVFDALLPPRGEVEVARRLTPEALASVFRPVAAREAWIVALFPYREEKIRALVRAVKFYGEQKPLPHLADAAYGFLLELIADRRLMHGWNTPLLIPVPSSPLRLRQRGYNQTERIASEFAKALGEAVLYAPKALARTDRKSQVRIPRKKRGENVRGTFYVPDEGAIKGRHVLLLDDVVESGATMKDARRALCAAGALDVLGIAITH